MSAGTARRLIGRIARALSFAEVRQVIGLPPDDTIRFFRAKDYATQAHWDELWQQEHARAFTVTKMLDGDLLAKVRASLDEVLAKGGTFEQWKAGIVPVLQSHGWYGKVDDAERTGVEHPIFVGDRRLRTIFDTNLRTAQAAGRWAGIQKAKPYRPYLMWDAVRDSRTRPLHRLWGGLDDHKPIILPVDHRCWTIYFPPCGWSCRCGVIQLSLRELQRRGLSVSTDAELVAKGWMTKSGEPGGNRKPYRRTDGTVERVPAGIDPGFAYNPGEDFYAGLLSSASEEELPMPRVVPLEHAPEMPAPRRRDASALLSVNTSREEAEGAFRAALGNASSDGATLLLTDRSGFPVAVSPESFIYRPDSSRARQPKLSPDRVRVARLLAETLVDPDEIWTFWASWGERDGKPGGRRLVKRYVARFEIDGIVERLLVVADYGMAGGQASWRVLSAYPKGGASDARVRGGTLAYRRT